MTPTTIVWFRTNLRVDDHGALADAARAGRVVPVYIHDPDDRSPSAPGTAARWWLHHSLASLAADLDALGSPMLFRTGEPGAVLAELCKQSGATAVAFCEGINPDEHERDQRVEESLDALGIEVHRSEANLLWAVGSVLTKAAAPYQVFTPFWKNAITQPPPEPTPAPKALTPPTSPVDPGTLASLGLLPTIDWAQGMQDRWTPGERAARACFDGFRADRLDEYAVDRNRLDIPGWSGMSPHLHFGELSVRRLWSIITSEDPSWEKHPSSESYLREVGWREFAQHLINHFPATVDRPLREPFERFPWRDDPEGLERWKRGRTGYPVVDAAMRQLWCEGWMPNRVCMIVASFLCKHLLISWTHGAAWFMDTLVDADLASNTLGWQWTAGCGADAAPYFRIFNPISQGQKFDPKGDYVRRWVPELRSLSAGAIHEPWRCPPMELHGAGVTLGETYPRPMVDHAEARPRALDAYETIKP